MTDGWRSNRQGNKQHLSVENWNSHGTVSACDKRGIFLTEEPIRPGTPKCKNCQRREEKNRG